MDILYYGFGVTVAVTIATLAMIATVVGVACTITACKSR
jgi:nicotinamide riboside transporter PnuC